MDSVVTGDGWAVGTLEALGEGPGFRKIRKELGVTAFGINAIILPPGYGGPLHFHDEQEEAYFVHAGTVKFEFGDGSEHTLGPGGVVWCDAPTVRGMRNVGDDDATVVAVGGKGGYVGRDGRAPEGVTERVRLPE